MRNGPQFIQCGQGTLAFHPRFKGNEKHEGGTYQDDIVDSGLDHLHELGELLSAEPQAGDLVVTRLALGQKDDGHIAGTCALAQFVDDLVQRVFGGAAVSELW